MKHDLALHRGGHAPNCACPRCRHLRNAAALGNALQPSSDRFGTIAVAFVLVALPGRVLGTIAWRAVAPQLGLN
jgi:hypothetical protein